ncbi:MAG: cytochrome c oxidase accessory protein CcoG [Myxococcota bacterium]
MTQSTINAPGAEKVLTTLSQDGRRIWMRPKISEGFYLNRRRVVGYTLIILFLLLPFVYVGGHPAILLDVAARRFHLLGATFHPTDSALLMLLMLAIFLGIFWITAVFGRVWCGWGCPQTVYMELIFRPIENFFEGGPGKQRQLDRRRGILPPTRRLLKYGVYAVIAFVLGNQFLSYFVGWERLATWVTSSPFAHPGGFAVMAATTGLVFIDFAWFREQMCTVVCPYARLQSALLDRNSVIVGYDALRGEARKRVKARTEGDGSGDCIDCRACVNTCPTGIDIREGLQLECIACTQCIDACDTMMDRVGKPRGLIRLSSQHALESGEETRFVRARTLVYPAIIAVLLGLMGFTLTQQGSADVTVLRQLNAPFVASDDGTVRNQLRVKIVNRAKEARTYRMRIPGVASTAIIAPQFPLRLEAGDTLTTPVFVTLDVSRFEDGKLPIEVIVSDDRDFEVKLSFLLLGPES